MAQMTSSSAMLKQTRRTRFVCISDTHNATIKEDEMPDGDVLIHCGDLTDSGKAKELETTIGWLDKLTKYEVKIIVAGNHDLTIDSAFYNQYGMYHHGQNAQKSQECRNIILNATSLMYLEHESRTIHLSSPNGPRTKFSIFGSPHTPNFPAPNEWAFMYTRPTEDDGVAASKIWSQVPLDTDILVTHGPAHKHRDETMSRDAAGCELLQQAMWRVRPRLALCGHIHEARGVERVRWNLDSKAPYAETSTRQWENPDPEGEMDLVDLTAAGPDPLLNDGSSAGVEDKQPGASRTWWSEEGSGVNPGLGTRGLSGNPESARSDQAALKRRLGRKETCIANCSIMAKPWVSQQRNKSIVVDLDLPI
ncbi:Metallo-dependent phosphatase-like protein [Pseudomassariella vexata]|uniref:Metallo-dependent phosphatase-like protein n=1 Tax=Pseudomassariella vexata TaxID=1141098 RepID=A0A1Y2EIE7_9PEZI|nr:Metallo-dependent phosphatase-like protein [Pseudomassariella vexata]ORY71348.1 Metallo-dependent phosphatase-like protein [Pseudomassariella vexata]